MPPSQVRSLLRWRIIAASLVAFNVGAALWVVAARSVPIGGGVGGGDSSASWTTLEMLDGSSLLVVLNYATGKTIRRTVLRPATTAGLCRVWWPAPAAGALTLLGLALALTRRGHRYVAAFSLPRLTTRRLMIAVAVLGADLGWVIRTPSWTDLLFGRWTPIVVDLFILHSVGVYGRRSRFPPLFCPTPSFSE